MTSKLLIRWRLYRMLHVDRRLAVCYVIRLPGWTVDVIAGLALVVVGFVIAVLVMAY